MSGSSSSPEITGLTALLANYTNSLSVTTLTQTNLSNAGYAWAAITNYVLTTPNQDVYSLFWVYFVSNVNGILNQTVVNQCINTLDSTTQAKCQTFYTLFYLTTEGIDVLTVTIGGVPVTTSTLGAPGLIAFLRANAPTASAISLNITNAITTAQTNTDVPVVVVPVLTTTNITYLFATPSTEWNVVHNLGRFPNVTTVDTANDIMLADVQYVDENNITISFGYPTAGTVYLT